MGRLQMKNVKEIAGLLYYRRKINGKDTYQRLPALDDPEFAQRYAELAADHTKAEPDHGTFAWLVPQARASTKFWEGTADSTRANYERYLSIIETPHVKGSPDIEHLGARSVKGLRHAHVFTIREHMGVKPGKWNNYLTVLDKLCIYAMDKGYLERNPCEEITRYAVGEHAPWPDWLIEQALEEGTPMTRLAIVTLLCSGQRIGDAIKIPRGPTLKGTVGLVQQKRKKEVFVPVHPMWKAAVEAMPASALTVLYGRDGQPFRHAATLRERINDLVDKLSPDYRYKPHGLRKNATCYLAECGLTPHQIGAITGMSPEMVEYYTRHINNRRVVAQVHHLVTGGKFLEARG